MIRQRVAGMPPWTMAVAAMLAVQLSNALSVPVIDQIGPAGTAWLRMCCGSLLLWLIARPAIHSLRRKDIPALIALGVATGFMTAFFLAAVERCLLYTSDAADDTR